MSEDNLKVQNRITAFELEEALDDWVNEEIMSGREIPDFWDELSTTERLANWLTERGFILDPNKK